MLLYYISKKNKEMILNAGKIDTLFSNLHVAVHVPLLSLYTVKGHSLISLFIR